VAAKVDAPAPLTERERWLLDRVEQLEKRVADLESKDNSNPSPAADASVAKLSAASDVAAVTPSINDGAPPANSLSMIELRRSSRKPAKRLKSGAAQTAKAEPFSFGRFHLAERELTHQRHSYATSFFTPEVRADVDYNYSFNHPKDDTIGGSSEVFRHGEVQVTQLGVGGDFHYDNVRARL